MGVVLGSLVGVEVNSSALVALLVGVGLFVDVAGVSSDFVDSASDLGDAVSVRSTISKISVFSGSAMVVSSA